VPVCANLCRMAEPSDPRPPSRRSQWLRDGERPKSAELLRKRGLIRPGALIAVPVSLESRARTALSSAGRWYDARRLELAVIAGGRASSGVSSAVRAAAYARAEAVWLAELGWGAAAADGAGGKPDVAMLRASREAWRDAVRHDTAAVAMARAERDAGRDAAIDAGPRDLGRWLLSGDGPAGSPSAAEAERQRDTLLATTSIEEGDTSSDNDM